jgi:hypothetical protein
MFRKSARLFHEVQRLPPRRTRIALLTPPCIMLALLIWQVVLGHQMKHPEMSNGEITGWTIFLWLIYLRLITVRLVTDVEAGELVVRLRGLGRKRRVPLGGIRSVETITFDAGRDYGGYGIRKGSWGQAYIAGGNQGVRIETAGGPAVIVGSTRSAELADLLRDHAAGFQEGDATECT